MIDSRSVGSCVQLAGDESELDDDGEDAIEEDIDGRTGMAAEYLIHVETPRSCFVCWRHRLLDGL